MATPEVPVVRPPAELTHATAGAFEALVAPHIAGTGAGLVVDLSGVSLVTSAGLSCLVRAGQQFDARGAFLVLAGGPRRLVKLFQLVGLDDMLPHFANAKEATAWIQRQVG